MTVTVRTVVSQGDYKTLTTHLVDCDHWTVQHGYLMALDANDELVRVFEPGYWAQAERTAP